ncbi:TIGR03545 family protein [Rhodopirellula halodulae]|uniref:TIGR03545 family protein n=1 Tax=Rhodopirellula halodulae TaxID=2894198 RepID=UPI001E46790E|nr:TIGR03545 family protein [Rhodopirellula sp. JC737]MCC9655390.1 TIGR03545 family protein [Rhodopirellula sp. JC737]
MIRWRFLLTRLIVVATILMLLFWGLGPMASYITVRGLEASTGAKAEIGATRVALFPPQIQFDDVRVADPRDDKEFRNAFQADSINFVIDGDALLRRRWVIDQGSIAGLQIGTTRDSSGHLDQTIEDEIESSGPSMIEQLLSSATDGLSDRAEALGKDLETVRTGKQIRERWKNEYERLVRETKTLEQRVETIREAASGIDNPLRDWPELQRTLAEAEKVREQLIQLRQSMNAMPEEMRNDLARLEQAKQKDLDKVDAFVPGDLSESKNFGVDLVSAEIRRSLNQLRDYLENGRTLANYTVVAPDTERVRGEDYDFLGGNRRPELMVRHCDVSGTMRADGKVFTLSGVVENMTPTPELLADPTRARLRLEGPETVDVDYVRDRRQGDQLDRLTLHWPEMNADPIRLGRGKDVGIAIAGGVREVWVQLASRGEHLEGRLVSKQSGVNMRVDVKGDAGASAAAIQMNQSLANVDQVEIDAEFEGTWKDIDLKLNTNLGDVFNNAARTAIASQMEASKAKVAAQVNEAHREQMLELNEWMLAQQNQAQSLLARADKSVEELSRKILNEINGADQYLGKLKTAFGSSLR